MQQATKVYCIAQGTIVNILSQPIMQNNFKNNMYVCITKSQKVILLFQIW